MSSTALRGLKTSGARRNDRPTFSNRNHRRNHSRRYLASSNCFWSQMSDLDEARRLLVAAEAQEKRVYGGTSAARKIELSAAWARIAATAQWETDEQLQ